MNSVHETWLKPNRRAILFGAIAPVAITVLGAWLFADSTATVGWTWRGVGLILMTVGLAVTVLMLRQLARPRVGYGNGFVKFYLRSGKPIDVPVEVIEAFFLGQGAAKLPGRIRSHDQSVNLVARLSQRHQEWERHEVKPALGNWCDGYVTIRGTWCEPLDGEVIRRLNRRLKEVKIEVNGDFATR